MLSIPGGIRLKPEPHSEASQRDAQHLWLRVRRPRGAVIRNGVIGSQCLMLKNPHWCWKIPIDAEKSLESQIWLMKISYVSYCFMFFPQHFSTNQLPCSLLHPHPHPKCRWWNPKLGVTIPPVAMMRSLCAIITWWGARTSEFLSLFLLVKQVENTMEMTMFLGKDMMNTVDGCRWKYHSIHGHCFGHFYVEPEDVECGFAWTYGWKIQWHHMVWNLKHQPRSLVVGEWSWWWYEKMVHSSVGFSRPTRNKQMDVWANFDIIPENIEKRITKDGCGWPAPSQLTSTRL